MTKDNSHAIGNANAWLDTIRDTMAALRELENGAESVTVDGEEFDDADALAERVDALEYQSQQDRDAKRAADDACVTYRQRQGEAEDAQRLAEQEAREALAAREDMKRMLADAEARAAAAEAENAQLWAEIETLTAPAAAIAA